MQAADGGWRNGAVATRDTLRHHRAWLPMTMKKNEVIIVRNCLLLFIGNLGRCITVTVSGNGLQPDGTRARFLSIAQSKLKLCSANNRPSYWSNLSCDWPSTAWAYFENETENGPSPLAHYMKECWCIISEVLQHSPESHFTGNALDINHYNDWKLLRTFCKRYLRHQSLKLPRKLLA